MREETIGLTSTQGVNQTYIEHLGHFLMDANLFNDMYKM